jgi:hypothetical protein
VGPKPDKIAHSLTQQGSPYNRQETLIVKDQRWNREIEENSRRKAQAGGMGETVAGAVLGGLVLGPFGKNNNWSLFRVSS